MKKAVAIICAIVMLFSFAMPAFASETNTRALKSYTNVTADSEVWFELNKPLKFLSIFNEEVEFDVQYLVESLLNSKIKMSVKCDDGGVKSGKSGKYELKFNVFAPYELSEDLKFSADVSVEMWMELNLENTEESVLNFIVKNPVDGKYAYMNLLDGDLQGMKEQLSAMATIFNGEQIAEVNGKIADLENKYAKVTTEGEYVVLTYTNDAFIDMIFEVMDIFYLSDDALVKSDEMNEAFMTLGLTRGTLPQAKMLVKALGIFGDDDAVVTKYKTDKFGNILEEKSKIRLDFNLFDLLTTCGLSEGDIYPLTRENADIDLVLAETSVYTNVDKTVVTMPILTEENSTKLLENLNPEYQPEIFWGYPDAMMEDGICYISMNEFASISMDDQDNLVCTANCNGETGEVVLTFKNDYFDTVTVKGNLNENNYYLNDIAISGDKPFKLCKDGLFVNIDVLNCVLGAEVTSVNVTYGKNANHYEQTGSSAFVERPNMGYVEKETEELGEFTFGNAESIGVIGGSDGPTAVFVTKY